MEERPNPAYGPGQRPPDRVLTGNVIFDAILGFLLGLILFAGLWYGVALLIGLMLGSDPWKNKETLSFILYLIVSPAVAMLVTAIVGFLIKKTYKHIGMGCLVVALALGIPVLGGLGLCAIITGVFVPR